LMTMPPLTSSEAQARSYFSKLRNLLEQYQNELSTPHQFQELSMGTSHDYHWAIQEGASMIRLGTSLFGPREEQK